MGDRSQVIPREESEAREESSRYYPLWGLNSLFSGKVGPIANRLLIRKIHASMPRT
ncbi:hypothetical protein PGT21_006810 [Puccinia graminis f. sp. tritici]|uniref:Uncharacterized protein n=1 Tax=Puccinia graminis f. sp. tritici TaxID=56615 RepID=A0A5B0PQY3_PUCGR|nr:hypothetical protein PGT21_006810 [Puccinia graminis f. sp. tritici]